MTTMVTDMDTERVWNAFLMSLPAHERHFVMQNELAWHDEYVSGFTSIPEIRNQIKEHFA